VTEWRTECEITEFSMMFKFVLESIKNQDTPFYFSLPSRFKARGFNVI